MAVLQRDEGPEFAQQQSRDGASLQNDADSPERGGQETDEHKEHPRQGMRTVVWVLVLTSILSSHFLYALDNTIVADVQPAIIADLGQIQKLPWISVAFVFATAAFTLVWGRLYGMIDGKFVFISAVAVFEIGTAVCGSAPTMDALIVGRTLCGVGAGGVFTGTMILISALTTLEERPAYLGLTGLAWGSGTVLGPVIGGAFADSSATWRWAFYLGLCIGAVVAPAYIFLLPRFKLKQGNIRQFDGVGMVLMVGAFVSGVMAISFGGAVYSWDSGRIIGLFVCSGILWICFGVQQSLCIATTRHMRLFPVEMLGSLQMLILFVQAASSISAIFVPVYYIPLYFEFVQGNVALTAAVRLLPYIFLFIFATVFNGVMMSKLGYYMPWFLLGGILVLVGGVLMRMVDRETSTSKVYGFSILIALGAGSYNQACFAVAQAKVAKELFALASAFISFAQVLGLAISLTVGNSVFLNRATTLINDVVPDVPRSTVQSAIAGSDASFVRNLGAERQAQVLAAISMAISEIYILVVVSGAVSVLLALFMGRDRPFTAADKPSDAEKDNEKSDESQ